MILEVQGPVYLGCLSICKSELGLGRDVQVGDKVLHRFDGLGKTLDCMPAAHGSGTSIVQDRIGRIVLFERFWRHKFATGKGGYCLAGEMPVGHAVCETECFRYPTPGCGLHVSLGS